MFGSGGNHLLFRFNFFFLLQNWKIHRYPLCNLLNSLLLTGDYFEGHLGLHLFLQENISSLVVGTILAKVGEVNHGLVSQAGGYSVLV